MIQSKVDYGQIWEQIIIGEGKSMVCFSHGTCVIFTEPQDNIQEAAVTLMKEWGPVHVGTPAGDFSVIHLKEHPGWAVTCHHDDILTYVDPSEGDFDPKDEIRIGMYGRSKRDTDSKELTIIHVKAST